MTFSFRGSPDAARRAFCVGYVRAVAEVDASTQAASVSGWVACLPPENATAALIEATLRWLREHPDMRVGSAYISITMAVRSSFPCR